MKLKRTFASIFATVALTAGGLAASSGSAVAATPCPTGKLCLWEQINFVDLDVTSTSTRACIYLPLYGDVGFVYGIGSYVNKLPVNAVVYHWSGSSYVVDGTIRPGGASSNSSNGGWFGEQGAVCMGGVTPRIRVSS